MVCTIKNWKEVMLEKAASPTGCKGRIIMNVDQVNTNWSFTCDFLIFRISESIWFVESWKSRKRLPLSLYPTANLTSQGFISVEANGLPFCTLVTTRRGPCLPKEKERWPLRLPTTLRLTRNLSKLNSIHSHIPQTCHEPRKGAGHKT